MRHEAMTTGPWRRLLAIVSLAMPPVAVIVALESHLASGVTLRVLTLSTFINLMLVLSVLVLVTATIAWIITRALGLEALTDLSGVVTKAVCATTVGLLLASYATFRLGIVWAYSRYQPIMSNSTEYADGFQESVFRAEARVGMSRTRLLSVLGTPLSMKQVCGFEIVDYSRFGGRMPGVERAYHQRAVILRDGSVVRVVQRLLGAGDRTYQDTEVDECFPKPRGR